MPAPHQHMVVQPFADNPRQRSTLCSRARQRRWPVGASTGRHRGWDWGCLAARTSGLRTWRRLAAASRPRRRATAPETARPLHQAHPPPPADTRACYTRSPTTIVRSAKSTRTCRVKAQFTASRTLMSIDRFTFTFINEGNPENV